MTPGTMEAFQEAHTELSGFIFYLAHRYKRQTPGCEFEDLCQLGNLKLLELLQSGQYAKKSKEELLAIFRTSLKRVMVDALRATQPVDSKATRVDLEEAAALVGESGFEDLYLRHLVDYLCHFVSPEAQALLKSLVFPTSSLIHESYKRHLRRQHLRKRNQRPPGPDRVTHVFVGNLLGFSVNKTKVLIKELQNAYHYHIASQLLGAACSKSYHSWKPSSATF